MFAHWVRLIEMVHSAEKMIELATDPDITSNELVNFDGEYQGIGVGVVEAPRGILFHHYEGDKDAITTRVNLIIPTTQNNPAINLEIKKVASEYINGGTVKEGFLNRIEMAFRTYDPCLSCSAHSLPGKMPLRISIVDPEGKVVKELKRG